MQVIINTLTEFNSISIAVRLLLAIIAGGIIGIERGKHGSAAGLRTQILVCIGSTMTALTGLFVCNTLNGSDDILRLAAQVISGIGFLGAGIILKDIGIGAVLLAIGFTIAYLLVRYQRNHDKKQENKNIEENKEKQENQ